MINELLTRIPSQEFLNKYPSNQWKDVISNVIEIGILNLRNSFGTDEFSKNDLRSILNELRHYNKGSQDFPTYKIYHNDQCKKLQEAQYFSSKSSTFRSKEAPLYDDYYINNQKYN